MKTKLIPFDLERLKAGKYLKLQTRGGRRAIVTSVETMNERRPISGYLVEEHVDFYACWQNGGVALCDGREHDNDLMMVVSSTPEPTPLDIPWHLIDKRWGCAAMDKDKAVFFYANPKIEYDGARWCNCAGNSLCLSVLAINTDGIIPELSLTKRPEPEVKYKPLTDEEIESFLVGIDQRVERIMRGNSSIYSRTIGDVPEINGDCIKEIGELCKNADALKRYFLDRI